MVFKAMRPSEITRETWVEERSPRRSPRTAPNGWEDDKALAGDRPGRKEQGRSGFVCPDESVEWRVCGKALLFSHSSRVFQAPNSLCPPAGGPQGGLTRFRRCKSIVYILVLGMRQSAIEKCLLLRDFMTERSPTNVKHLRKTFLAAAI